jgi:hypothetical protein
MDAAHDHRLTSSRVLPHAGDQAGLRGFSKQLRLENLLVQLLYRSIQECRTVRQITVRATAARVREGVDDRLNWCAQRL